MYIISNITFCLYSFASRHLTANNPLRSQLKHKLVKKCYYFDGIHHVVLR